LAFVLSCLRRLSLISLHVAAYTVELGYNVIKGT
jgi:hypothetical protein